MRHISAGRSEIGQTAIFHRVFRREFSLMSEVVSAEPQNRRAAVAVARHAWLMLTLLREHHHAQDSLLWPLLRRRTPIYSSLITTMEEQHAAIAALTVPVERGLLEYAKAPGGPVQAKLVRNLDRLYEALREHLDLEAAEVFPLIAERLSAQDWGWQQISFNRHRVRKELVRAGALLEDATPGERRRLLRRMPLNLRLAWQVAGERVYMSYIDEVRALLE